VKRDLNATADAGLEWDEFSKNRITFLRLVAQKARIVASRHLNDDNFFRLIRIAYDGKIISAAQLGEFGRRDPTAASRWINRHSSPDSFAQEAILSRIAEVAEEDADKLQRTTQREPTRPQRVRTG
jgi:hypothetical protein